MNNFRDMKNSLPYQDNSRKSSKDIDTDELTRLRKIREQRIAREISASAPKSGKWERGINNTEFNDNKEGEFTSSAEIIPQVNDHFIPKVNKVKGNQLVDIANLVADQNPHFPFVKGAGVIGWKIEGIRLKFLMSRKMKKSKNANGSNTQTELDIFGGKYEASVDLDSASTAAREFSEEVSCEPYLALNNLPVPETQIEIKKTLKDSQRYFEKIIREYPNFIQNDIAWGVYFCPFPDIPMNCFRERENALYEEGGDLFTAVWVDIWDLLNKSALSLRMRSLNLLPAIECIYKQLEKEIVINTTKEQ